MGSQEYGYVYQPTGMLHLSVKNLDEAHFDIGLQSKYVRAGTIIVIRPHTWHDIGPRRQSLELWNWFDPIMVAQHGLLDDVGHASPILG